MDEVYKYGAEEAQKILVGYLIYQLLHPAPPETKKPDDVAPRGINVVDMNKIIQEHVEEFTKRLDKMYDGPFYGDASEETKQVMQTQHYKFIENFRKDLTNKSEKLETYEDRKQIVDEFANKEKNEREEQFFKFLKEVAEAERLKAKAAKQAQEEADKAAAKQAQEEADKAAAQQAQEEADKAAAKQAQEEADKAAAAAAKQAQEEADRAAAAAAKQAQEEADRATAAKKAEEDAAAAAKKAEEDAAAAAKKAEEDAAAAKQAQEEADKAAQQAQEEADKAAAKQAKEEADKAAIENLKNQLEAAKNESNLNDSETPTAESKIKEIVDKYKTDLTNGTTPDTNAILEKFQTFIQTEIIDKRQSETSPEQPKIQTPETQPPPTIPPENLKPFLEAFGKGEFTPSSPFENTDLIGLLNKYNELVKEINGLDACDEEDERHWVAKCFDESSCDDRKPFQVVTDLAKRIKDYFQKKTEQHNKEIQELKSDIANEKRNVATINQQLTAALGLQQTIKQLEERPAKEKPNVGPSNMKAADTKQIDMDKACYPSGSTFVWGSRLNYQLHFESEESKQENDENVTNLRDFSKGPWVFREYEVDNTNGQYAEKNVRYLKLDNGDKVFVADDIRNPDWKTLTKELTKVHYADITKTEMGVKGDGAIEPTDVVKILHEVKKSACSKEYLEELMNPSGSK